jgi:hypothetical protein
MYGVVVRLTILTLSSEYGLMGNVSKCEYAWAQMAGGEHRLACITLCVNHSFLVVLFNQSKYAISLPHFFVSLQTILPASILRHHPTNLKDTWSRWILDLARTSSTLLWIATSVIVYRTNTSHTSTYTLSKLSNPKKINKSGTRLSLVP